MPHENQTPRPLTPAGRFRGKVTEHDLGEAGTGTPQLAIGFAFTDNEGVAQRITSFHAFTEGTLASEYGVAYALRNLGWDPEENGWAVEQLARKSAENPNGGVLIGKEADITIEHETYDGKVRAKVAWVNAPGGGLGMKKRCEGAEVGTMADRIRALAGSGAGPTPSTGPAKKETAKAGGKSGLPF